MLMTTTPKPRKCEHCPTVFTPRSMGHAVCSPRCLLKKVAADEKAKKARAKVDREHTRARKEAIKNTAELISEAQTAFNAFIRARDAHQPCICCGKPFEPNKPGGSMDAGHWRSRGAAPHLRFNEDNCHGQRKNCNRPGGAKAGPFREGMIERIGLERVQALEASNAVHKWTADELRAIRALYRLKLKALQRDPV